MNLKSLQYDGVDIPVSTPCKLGGNVTPACQIVGKPESTTIGTVIVARCTTCDEIVNHDMIR